MSEKDGWKFPEAHRTLEPRRIEAVVAAAAPGRRIVRVERVSGGFSNANHRVELERGEVLLVRGCVRSPAAARKEADLYERLRGVVPVPEVVHVDAGGEGEPPCVVLRWIDGISLRDLRQSKDADAIAQAARSVGRVLFAIGGVSFVTGGFLGPGLAVEPMGDGTALDFIEGCLRSEALGRRVGAGFADRVRAFVERWRGRAGALEGRTQLVHSDFNGRNILVREGSGGWSVAGVIDWEFAFAGSPLFDFGNLLRYERAARPALEPHVSRGYREAGGALPEGWRELARVGDLTALCELLARPELDAAVAAEIEGLVGATLEGRDPP